MTERSNTLSRYNSLASALRIFRASALTLLPPETWDDGNDRLMMANFKEAKKLKSLVALWFNEAGESMQVGSRRSRIHKKMELRGPPRDVTIKSQHDCRGTLAKGRRPDVQAPASLTHALQHRADDFCGDAEVATVQPFHHRLGGCHQATLLGHADEGGCPGHLQPEFLSDGTTRAFVHQHQRWDVRGQGQADAGGLALVEVRQRSVNSCRSHGQ